MQKLMSFSRNNKYIHKTKSPIFTNNFSYYGDTTNSFMTHSASLGFDVNKQTLSETLARIWRS